MKVMLVYNRYRHRVHGEEVVVDNTARLLRSVGVAVTTFTRSAEQLPQAKLGKVVAGLAGIYNPRTRYELSASLRRERPDVVHAHNLYPWISPSALVAADRAGVPIVMTVHHYGLTCPVLTHFRSGAACDDCVSGGEWNCVRHNCRNSMAESMAYALRAFVARQRRWFLDRVALFIALSSFAKEQLQRAGFPGDKIVVRPNSIQLAPPSSQRDQGEYVAYAGRLTYEKGVDLLCKAARLSGLPVHIAGNTATWPELVRTYSKDVIFRGVLSGEALKRFYLEARFLVVPSRWWEVCPLVVLEAMNYGCPVLAAASGGLPELLDHGRAGMLFASESCDDLARNMTVMWNDAPLRARMSNAARERLVTHYAEDGYLTDLLEIYRRASCM